MELADSGAHKFRSGKEEHLFNPQTIHLFQKACWTNDYSAFKQFTSTVDNMGADGVHLRSCWTSTMLLTAASRWKRWSR